MTQRLEAFITRKYVTREGEEKTAWTRVGVAFAHSKGGGWNVSLEAFPAPTVKDGKPPAYELVLMPPRPKDQGASADDSQEIPDWAS